MMTGAMMNAVVVAAVVYLVVGGGDSATACCRLRSPRPEDGPRLMAQKQNRLEPTNPTQPTDLTLIDQIRDTPDIRSSDGYR